MFFKHVITENWLLWNKLCILVSPLYSLYPPPPSSYQCMYLHTNIIISNTLETSGGGCSPDGGIWFATNSVDVIKGFHGTFPSNAGFIYQGPRGPGVLPGYRGLFQDLEFYQDTGVYFRTWSSTRIQGFVSGPGVLPGYRGLFQDLEFFQDTGVYFRTLNSTRIQGFISRPGVL